MQPAGPILQLETLVGVTSPTQDTELPFWFNDFDPLAWDTFYVNDDAMPGIAEVSGSGLARKLDVKQPKGADKATIADNGEEAIRFDLTLTIYSESDWKALKVRMQEIVPTKIGGTRKPFSVAYPTLTIVGIKHAYTEKMPIIQQNKADQTITVKFALIEWTPAPKPLGGGGGAVGILVDANGVPKDPGPTPKFPDPKQPDGGAAKKKAWDAQEKAFHDFVVSNPDYPDKPGTKNKMPPFPDGGIPGTDEYGNKGSFDKDGHFHQDVPFNKDAGGHPAHTEAGINNPNSPQDDNAMNNSFN